MNIMFITWPIALEYSQGLTSVSIGTIFFFFSKMLDSKWIALGNVFFFVKVFNEGVSNFLMDKTQQKRDHREIIAKNTS